MLQGEATSQQKIPYRKMFLLGTARADFVKRASKDQPGTGTYGT